MLKLKLQQTEQEVDKLTEVLLIYAGRVYN